MNFEDSVQLLKQYQLGDERAAGLLFERYFDQLDRFAERRMSPQLKRRVGSDDVAQSVFRSFFDKLQKGEFQLEESGELWKLLAHLAARKIMRKVEFNRAAKRSMAAERPIDSHHSDEKQAAASVVDAQAVNPQDAAEINDSIEFVLKDLCPQWRQILELSHEHFEVAEIAKNVNVSETDVRRVMILRMKCRQQSDNAQVAEVLQCSEVTVRRLWRELLETTKKLVADAG